MPGSRIALRLCCAVALLGAVVAGCGSTRPRLLHRAHSNLISMFEDEHLLRTDPPQALGTLKALGVDEVRVFIPWSSPGSVSSFAPDPTATTAPKFDASDPAAYPPADWSLLDEIVRDAATDRIGLDFTVGGPIPKWAEGPGAPHGSQYDVGWMPSASRFGQFVRALGLRYSGRYVPPGQSSPLPRVDFWSIWNEPNYGHYLSPQATGQVEVAPRLYRALLDAAWSALEATGHNPRRDTILIGETAPRGVVGPGYPGDFGGMMPLRFIRALYCVGANLQRLQGRAATQRGCPGTAAADERFVASNPALFRATGFADHPYPDASAPNLRTVGVPGDSDYADFAALPSLESTLDRAVTAWGQKVRLPIYSTEFGYRTNPPTALGVPLKRAALYLNQAEYLSWLNPRIRSYDQYLLTDPGPTARSDFDTGIESWTGAPKPYVYDAYRMPLYLPVTHSSRRNAELEVWGCVRPAPVAAVRTDRVQQVQIQFEAGGSSGYRTLTTISLTDPHGYFDTLVRFPSSGQIRLRWSGSGHALYSRTQTITLS